MGAYFLISASDADESPLDSESDMVVVVADVLSWVEGEVADFRCSGMARERHELNAAPNLNVVANRADEVGRCSGVCTA
jgi:F420-0:gamma-glutamyl ligase